MNLRKSLKLGEVLTKIIPLLFSIVFVFNSTVSYLYETPCRFLSIIIGMSYISLFYIWFNAKYIYRFCLHQLLFIYYALFVNTLAILDELIGLPINDIIFYNIFIISFGIAIIFYAVLKYKENLKNNKV